MTANPILLQKKYSRVIECFAKAAGALAGCGIGISFIIPRFIS